MHRIDKFLFYPNFFLLLVTLCLLISGCKGTPPEKPLPSVTIARPVEQEVKEWDEYSGRLESPQVANVTARVTGIILSAPFEEGSMVKQGDLLFVIDDRSFKAEFESKQAEVAKAEAIYKKAQLRLQRFQKVLKSGAISAEDYDQAIAESKQSQSELAAAKAAEDIAKLNLDWTQVRAPISGQVSRKMITEGNIVNGGSGQMTQLTTITSIDPLYSYVSVPEDAFQKYKRVDPTSLNAESLRLPCEFLLEGSQEYHKDCYIDFVDSKVNISTGTVQLRGVIPNPQANLKSGMFVRMRVPGTAPYKAILVPDIAIGADQNSKFVLVVNAQGVVEARPVKTGAQFEKLRAIKEGVKIEDRIVVFGLQAARPGTKVNASEGATANPLPGTPPATAMPGNTATASETKK